MGSKRSRPGPSSGAAEGSSAASAREACGLSDQIGQHGADELEAGDEAFALRDDRAVLDGVEVHPPAALVPLALEAHDSVRW